MCRVYTVWFLDKDGVELFQIGQDKIGCRPFNTVYIKEYNSIAVSSLEDKYLTMIDIESQEVTTTVLYHVNHNMSRYQRYRLCSKVCIQM
jgi:hypothetical protein